MTLLAAAVALYSLVLLPASPETSRRERVVTSLESLLVPLSESRWPDLPEPLSPPLHPSCEASIVGSHALVDRSMLPVLRLAAVVRDADCGIPPPPSS
ncbi:MAG TPA: hypothetical protein VIB62_00745 [Actinomycetota bacterium]